MKILKNLIQARKNNSYIFKFGSSIVNARIRLFKPTLIQKAILLIGKLSEEPGNRNLRNFKQHLLKINM